MWRGLRARKVRLLLSALAIVLGVAFIGGAQVFSATLEQTLVRIMAGTMPDVGVAPTSALDSTRLAEPTLSAELLESVRALPEVGRAEGTVSSGAVYVLDSDGRPMGGAGAPTLGFSYDDMPVSGGLPGLTALEGVPPQRAGEVGIDPETARNGGLEVGDTVRVITPFGGADDYVLTGIIGSNMPSFGGATVVNFDIDTSFEVLGGKEGYFHTLSATPAEGKTPEEAAEAIRTVVPDDAEVKVGSELLEESMDELDEQMGFITTVLYGFAAVSVLVGTFLIVNTFSMIVAQRRRELALVRAVGARSGQVLRVVLFEALVVGVVASALGVLVGMGLARAVIWLFTLIGLDISGTGLVLRPVPLLVAFLVGVAVTVVSAWLPARTSARIAPVEALRAAESRRDLGLARGVVGAGVLVLGLALLGLVISRTWIGQEALALGAGIVLVLTGLVLVAAILGRPFIRAAGALLRPLYGRVGTLASLNAERNPRRTGTTAAALMVGLALVTTMSVVAQSAKLSVSEAVGESMSTPIVVTSPMQLILPPEVADAVAETDGVARVTRLGLLPLQVDGQDEAFVAEEHPGTVITLDIVEGSLSDVGGESVAVSSSRAEELDVSVGDDVLMTSNGQQREITVAAIFRATPGAMAPWLGDRALATAFGWPEQQTMIGVDLSEGAQVSGVRDAIHEALADYPMATAYDNAAFTQMQAGLVDQLVGVVYALLALAVIISLLGVVNTLALSVAERTRELGLLRGVGMRRAAVRRMVRLEAVIISLLGAVLGVLAGLVFGIAVQRFAQDEGLMTLSVPWVQLLAFVVVAAVIGMLAALVPARQASRTDVLTAIAAD